MEKSLNWREFIITRLIKASGYSAILFVALIFFFLVREGMPTFGRSGSLFTLQHSLVSHRRLFWHSASHHRLAHRDHRCSADRCSIWDWHSRLHLRDRSALDA